MAARGRPLWCGQCGRHRDDCPGGLWSSMARNETCEGICVYCARAALRSLDPASLPPVTSIAPGPDPRRRYELLRAAPADGPEAA